MCRPANSPTARKAGYILLTSAMFHAKKASVTQILSELRFRIADEMSADELTESHELIAILVYPRFY